MSKHTPGKWMAEGFGEINSELANGKWAAITIVKANHEGSVEVTEEEAEANGRLIIAAPEMFDLLVKVQRIISIPSVVSQADLLHQIKQRVIDCLSRIDG